MLAVSFAEQKVLDADVFIEIGPMQPLSDVQPRPPSGFLWDSNLTSRTARWLRRQLVSFGRTRTNGLPFRN